MSRTMTASAGEGLGDFGHDAALSLGSQRQKEFGLQPPRIAL